MSNNNNPILRALSRVRKRDQELKEQGYETPRDHYKRQVQETQNAREQQKLYNQLGRRTPYEDEDYKSALATGIGSVPSKLANISGNLANLYDDFDRSSAGLFRSLDDNQKGVYDKYKSLINTKRSISDLSKKREEAWKYNDHQEAAALDQQIMELTKQEQSLRLTKDEEIILGSEVMYDTEDKLKNSSFLGGVNITGAKGSGKNVRDAVFNRIGLEDYRESYDNDNTAALNDIMGELFNKGKPTGLEWGKNYVNDQNVQRDRAAIDDPDDGFLTSLGKSFQVIGDNPAEAATVIGEAVPYLAGPWIGGLTSVADTAGSVGSAADKLRKKRGTDFLDKSDQYRLAAAGTGILASNYISMSVFGNALKGNTIGNRLVGSASDGLIKKTGSDLSASVPLGVTRSLGGKATDMVAEGGQEMFQTALEAYAADEKVTKQDLAWAGALGMTAAGGFAAPGLASDALRGSAGIYDNVANGNQRLEEIITNDESLDVNNKYYDPSRVINRTVNEASAENATEEQLNKSFNTITDVHNNLQGQVKELREQRARQEQASQLMQELRDTTIPEDTRAEKTQQLQEVMAQIAEGPSDDVMDSLDKVEEAAEKAEAAYVKGYRQLDEIRANRGFGEFKGAEAQAEVDADGNPIPKMKQFAVDTAKPAQSIKGIKEDLSVADTDAEIDAAVQASETAATVLQGKVEAYKESDNLLTSIEDNMATLSKQIESRDVAIKQAKDEESAATLGTVQEQAKTELQELLERRSAIIEQRTQDDSLDTASFEKELEKVTKETEAIKQKANKLKEQREAKIEKLDARIKQLEGKTDARSVKEYERITDELSELTEGRLNNKQRQIRQAKRENDKAKQQQEVFNRAEERLKQLETRETEINDQIASEKQGRNDSTTIGLLNNELKEVQGRIKTFKGRLGKTSKKAVDDKVTSSQQKLDKLLGKKKPKPKAKSKKTDSDKSLATVVELKEDLKERQALLASTRDKMDEDEEGSDTYKALDKFAKQLEKDIDEINTSIRNLEGVKTKKTKVSKSGEVTTEVSRDEDTLTRKLRNFFNNADIDGNLEIELTPEKMASLLDIARQLDELRLKENELKSSGDVNDNILNGDKKQNWLGLRDYEAALALAIENGDIKTFNRYIGHLQVFMDDHNNKAKALEKAYELQKTEGPQVVYRVKNSRTEWEIRNASTLEATGLPQKLRATGSILVKPNTKKLVNTVRTEADMITEKYNVLKDLQKELTEQNTGSNRGKKLLTTKKTNSGQGLVNSFIKRSKDKAANYTAKKSGDFADISYVYEDGVEYAKFNQLLWGRHFRNSTKTNERPKGLSYDPVVKEMHAIGALATKSIAFGSTTQFAGDIDYTQPYTNMEALDKVYQDQWLKDNKAKAGYADWEAVFHDEFAGHNNSKMVYGQDYTSDDVVAIIRNEMSDKDAINEARNAEIDAAIAAGATIILPRQFKGSKEADTKHNELIKYLADRGYELQDSKDSLSIEIAGKPVKVNTFKKTGEATVTPTPTETETDTESQDTEEETDTKGTVAVEFEVSTKGNKLGKQFSATNASFKPGTIILGVDVGNHTIEEVYQTLLKEGTLRKFPKGTKKQQGKFKPEGFLNAPDNITTKEALEDYSYVNGYLPLWQVWATQNVDLMKDLRKETNKGKVLKDSFAKTRVSQARALTDILNGNWKVNESFIANSNTDKDNTSDPENVADAESLQLVRDLVGTAQNDFTVEEVSKYLGIGFNRTERALDQLVSEGVITQVQAKTQKQSAIYRLAGNNNNNSNTNTNTFTQTGKPTTTAPLYENTWFYNPEGLTLAIKEDEWVHHPVEAIETNVAEAEGKLDVSEDFVVQKDTRLNSQKDFFSKYIANKDYEAIAKMLGFELTEANKRQVDAFIRLHNRISERASEALKVKAIEGIGSLSGHPLYNLLVKTRPKLDVNGQQIVNKKGVPQEESYIEENTVTALALGAFQYIQTGGRNPYLDQDQVREVHGLDDYTQLDTRTQSIVSKWGSQRGFVFQELGKGAIRALGLRVGPNSEYRTMNRLEAEMGALTYYILNEKTNTPFFIEKLSNEVTDDKGNPGLLTNGERVRTVVSGMSKGRAINFLQDLGKEKYDPDTGEPLFSTADIEAFKKAKNVGEIVNLLRENKNGYFYTTVHLVRPAISQVWDPKSKTSTGFYNPDILDIIESSKKEKGDKDLLNELFDSAYEREAPMDEMPETFDQQTVIKGTTKVPRNQQEALLKISQQEWGVETTKADMMINLYDNNREQFYMLLGVNTDEQIAAMHPSDREAALTDRRIAMDLFEKQIAWLKGRKDDKSGSFAGYFQRPVVWVNQRVGYASTLWNAQTNMFARMLSNLKAWATDIDINEDIIPEQASDITLHGRFFLMLAENMEGASNHMDFGDMEYNGVTYPKKRYRKSARTVDKVLPQDFLPRFLNYLETSPVIADAISAINSLNDNGTMTDSEAAAVTKAVAELDQGELSLGALMEYASYLRAKEEGSATYTTTMGSQSDGITNGPMITKFLLGVASPAIRLMGGIIGKQDVAEGIIDFFETKARGNQDLYENTGYSMQNSLAEYVPTGTLLSRTVATVGLIDDDFGSRSWAKKLLTPFNYGSGLAKLRQAINDNVVAKFEREFKDIYAENTTKADRGKALTAFNKKLASIVNEYNDIFVHRAINEGNLESEIEKLVAIHNGTKATEKQIEPTLTTEEKIDRFRELYNVKEDQKDMDVLNWLSFKVLRGGNSNIATKAITLNDIEQDLSKEYLHAVDSLSNITYGTAAIRAIEKDEAIYIKKRDQLTAMAGLAFSNFSDLRILYIREFAADPNNITRAELDKIERELAKSKAAVASALSNLNLDENGRRSQTISSGIDLEKTTFKTVTNLAVPFNTLNRQRNEEATKSYGFGYSYKVMGDPGVRTLGLMIQSLDAATSIQAIAAVAGMNFHDANVFGLKDLAKGVAAQNKSFYQTIIKYEPSIEVAKAVLRPVYRARELYRDPNSSPNLKKGAEQLIARMASQRNAVIEMLHTVYDTEMHKLQQTSSNDQYIHQYGGLGGVHEITEEERQAVLRRYHELSAERDRAIQDFIELIEDYKTEEDVVEEDVINEEVEDPSSTETIVAQMQQLDEGQKRELINKALTSGSVNVRDLIGLLKNLVPDLPNLPNNFSGLMKTLDALNDETLGNIKVEFTNGDKEAEAHGYDVAQIRFSPFSKRIIIPYALLNTTNANGDPSLMDASKEETVSLIPLEAIVKELAVATFHTNMQFIKTGSLKNPELSKTFQELRSVARTLSITGSYKRYFDMDNEADVRAFELLQNLFSKNFSTSPEELIYLALYNAEVRDALSRIPFKGPADSFRNKSLLSSIKSLFKRVISRGNLNLSEGSATLADIAVGAGELLIGDITEKRLGNSTNKPMTVNGLIQEAFSTQEAEWMPKDVHDLTSYVDGRLMLELHKLKNAHDNNAIPLTELIHVLKRALLSYNPPNTGADHEGYKSTLLPMLTILERHLKNTKSTSKFVLAESAEDFASSTLSEQRAMKQATVRSTIAYWAPNIRGTLDGTLVIHTSNIANGAVSASTLVHELFHSLTSPALTNWLPDNATEKMKKQHEYIKNFKLDVHTIREATADKINQMYRDGELTDNQMTRVGYALDGDAYYTKVFKTVDGQPVTYFEPTGIEDHENHPMSKQYDDAPKVDEFLAELSSNALLQDIVKQVTTDMNKRKKSGKQFPELEQYYRDTLRVLGIEDSTGKYTLAAGNAYRNFGIMFAELSAILTDNNFEEDVVHPNALKPYSNTFEGFNAGLMHLLPAEQAKSIANNFSQFLDGVVVPFLKGQAQDVIEAGEAIGVTPSDPNDKDHIPSMVLKYWEELITRLSVAVDMNSNDQKSIANIMYEVDIMLKQFRENHTNYLEQLDELSLINVDSAILNAKERAHKDNGIKKAKEYGIIEEETDKDQMTAKDRRKAIQDQHRALVMLSNEHSSTPMDYDRIRSGISEILNNLRTNYPNEYLPTSYSDSNRVFTLIPYDLLNDKERRIQAIQRAYLADRVGFNLDSDNLSDVYNRDSISIQHSISDLDIKIMHMLYKDIQQAYADALGGYSPDVDAKVKELLHLINHSMSTKGPYLILVPAKVFTLMPYKYLNEEQKHHAKAAKEVEVLKAFNENPAKHLAEARKIPGYLSYVYFLNFKGIDKSLLTQEELEFYEYYNDIPFYVTPELQLAVDTAADIINHSNMDDNLDIDEDAGGAVRDEERFSPVQIADFLGGIVGNKNGYLDAVIRNVVNPLMDKIPASLVEGYDHTKVWHDAIISGNAVYTTRALDAGFELDDQQAYVLEVLEVALLNTLNDVSNTTVFRQLQRSYDQAKSKVKVEDFHNGPWSETTQEERDIAYAKYNLVFRPGVGGTTDGTSDYLSNFAALALVSPEMQRVLSFSNPRSTRPEETTWFENLVSLYDRVVDYWNDKSTDLNPNDTVNNRVRDLTTALAAIYYKNHDKVVDANRSKFLDIEENLAKVGDGIILKMRQAGIRVLSVPALRDKNASKVGVKYLQGKFENFDKYVNYLFDYIHPNTPLGDVRETFNEIAGTLSESEHLNARQVFGATKAIEAERGAIIEDVGKAMINQFNKANRDLSKEENKGITNTLLRPDLHVLLDRLGFSGITNLIKDREALNNEIRVLEDALATHPQGNEYIYRARALGKYMVTRQSSNGMLAKNAYAIAERVGTGQTASYSPEVLQQIDELVSLYALRNTKQSDKDAFATVLEREAGNPNEVNGLEYLLMSHAESSHESDALFEDNPYSRVKGHVPTILNPQKGFKVVNESEVADYESLGYVRASSLNQGPLQDLRGNKVLMTISNTGKQRYVSGAFSIEETNKSGTIVVRRGDPEFNRLVREAQRDVHRAGNTFFNEQGSQGSETNLVPSYDQDGNIISFSYEMSSAGLDTYLDRNNNPVTLLSQYKGSNLGKKNFPLQNKRIVDFAIEQFANADERDKRKFVKVSPDSDNPKARAYWNSLPRETQMYIESRNGGSFLYMRNDELNMMFGFRKFNPGNAFDKDAMDRNILEAMYVGLFELPFGSKAKLRHDQTYALWVDIIKKLKDFIVIRNFKVLFANIKSNVAFLMLNASDPINAYKDIKDALTYSLVYQKDMQELNKIKHELKIGLSNPDKVARYTVLRDKIARNPLRDFIEAGMMPMIVNDMSFKQGEVEYENALDKGINTVFGKLPTPLRNSAEFLLVSPGTPLYSFLSNATQQSDFVFKYALYKQELRKGKSRQQAMDAAREVFIDYDIPTNRAIQFMNDIGLWMFTKFALRIQRVLMRYAREKPGKLAVEHIISTELLGNPSLISLNLANYFMGGSNPFRVPTDGVLTMWGNATPIQAIYAVAR